MNPIQFSSQVQTTKSRGGILLRMFLAGAAFLSIAFAAPNVSAQATMFYNGIIHTVANGTFTNGVVVIETNKITLVLDGKTPARLSVQNAVDLKGKHLYPGLIAVNSGLGLGEIDAVRATQDAVEVGDFTPDVLSWMAVSPDSELLPVARANGITHFEPVPRGPIVSGQSGLLAIHGWTFEEMTVRKPVALHLFWPSMDLNLTPREHSRSPSQWKSLDDQAKERRARLRAMEDFFEEARAYAKARDAAANGAASRPIQIPAWDAMVPFIRGELPIMIHANDARQIKTAVSWAVTNKFNIAIVGGRDAWRVADMLASNNVPVVFDQIYAQPVRDFDSYDAQFNAPEVLRRAGVKVVLSIGLGGFAVSLARNLPYVGSQAIAFGLPPDYALKTITLYPAQLMGVENRLGSIEEGKEATLFVCDGDIFDFKANVTRMWIAGNEVSLESRHTRFYEKYRNRPRP